MTIGREELIRLLVDLAGPIGPLGFEDAPQDDALFIDWVEQRSRKQFERIQDEAVDAFIDVVMQPPVLADYIPPTWDQDVWELELLDLAGLYGRTPHAARILQSIEPALRSGITRLLAIQVLGRLGGPTARAWLGELASSGVPNHELPWLVEAIGETGGLEARELLESMRERFTDPEVQSAIDTALATLPES